jgi:hypothetical protein
MPQHGTYCSLSMSLDARVDGRIAAGFCTGNYYAVEGGLLVR